jgi:hypothetical protein
MNLSALEIALQGIGFIALALAMQGLTAAETTVPQQTFYRHRVKVIRRKRENDEALLLFVL